MLPLTDPLPISFGTGFFIGLAFLCVAEHFVRFVDFLEAIFRAFCLVLVRVEFTRQFAIGTLDLLSRSRAGDTENLVVVLVFHRAVETGAAANLNESGELACLKFAKQSCDRVAVAPRARTRSRSEEHTSELQSLMRLSYAVFCLKKKKK